MKEPIIYADTTFAINTELGLSGERLGYFYMHGKAEDLTKYDCCNGNIEAFSYSLSYNHFFLADMVFEHTNIPTQRCIVFTQLNQGRIVGRILLLDDLEGIEQCKKWVSLIGYEHHLEELKNNHAESYSLLKKLRNENELSIEKRVFH